MHARVVTVHLHPGKREEAVRIFRDSVIPAAKQQKGFHGGFLLTDPNTDKAIAFTLWETETDLRAGETSGYFQEQLAKFAPIFAAPPEREAYEVTVQA